MRIIPPSVSFWHGPDYATACSIVEQAARTCYQSADRTGEGTAEKLITHCISRGHESVLEHAAFGMRFVVDRGVSHELVRHRIGVAFSQESTRYVRYGGDMEFVQPWWWGDDSVDAVVGRHFEYACMDAEHSYKEMLKHGAAPQAARAVLPSCLKTEIAVTANLREWRHIFKLRRSPAAHPDMRGLMDAAWEMARTNYPVFFEEGE